MERADPPLPPAGPDGGAAETAFAFSPREQADQPRADRIDVLREDSRPGPRTPARLREAVELVEETRRRLELNVTEELACEALGYRLQTVLER